MIIRVEQRHIDKGMRSKCFYCPISLAIGDRIDQRDPFSVSTNICSAVLFFRGEWKNIDLPKHVTQIILDYDDTGLMRPFEFEFGLEV